jgi:hypothetical protein
MEVTFVDDQPAFHLVLVDADDLDSEGAGEAALQSLLKELRGGQERSSAAPSS